MNHDYSKKRSGYFFMRSNILFKKAQNILIVIGILIATQSQANYLDLEVSNDPIYPDNKINISWDGLGTSYSVQIKDSWTNTVYENNNITSSNVSIGAGNKWYLSVDQYQNIICETDYKVKVKENGKSWRREKITTGKCTDPDHIVNVPFGDLSDHVRISSYSYNKCIYPYTPIGINNLQMHNWVCYANPIMAFKLIPAGTAPDQFKLYSAATNSCLKPNSSANYATMTGSSCSSNNTVFQVQDMGSSTFRLRNISNDKCLFGSPVDGGLIRQDVCWSHDGFLFQFQAY